MRTTIELWDICQNRHRGNAQSVAAQRRSHPQQANQRAEVLRRIRNSGTVGMTCEEIADGMGVSVNRISGRISELKLAGAIVRTGTRPTRTGSPAAVYVAERTE